MKATADSAGEEAPGKRRRLGGFEDIQSCKKVEKMRQKESKGLAAAEKLETEGQVTKMGEEKAVTLFTNPQ